ncbi:MAG: type IV pilin protein [Thermodesulfobacteriota bacterium]|nr:MAG: type IV pilin protein [Thermodesulfobacteriota bacterium]
MTERTKKPNIPAGRADRAQDGFTVLELLFIMAIIGILAAIAIPMYTRFIQKARETSVISYLSKVVRAEEMYYIDSPTVSYTGDFDELETTGMIAPSTGTATRVEHDYTFSITAGAVAGKPFWNVTADPVNGSLKARWFYADETGALRFETGGVANASSPQVQN